MIKNRILAVSAAFLLGLGGAVAQEPKDHARKSQQAEAQVEREAEEMLGAVVRVRMKAISDARSNTTLGPKHVRADRPAETDPRRPHRKRTQERACAPVAGSRDRGAARASSRDTSLAGRAGGQGRGEEWRHRRRLSRRTRSRPTRSSTAECGAW